MKHFFDKPYGSPCVNCDRFNGFDTYGALKCQGGLPHPKIGMDCFRKKRAVMPHGLMPQILTQTAPTAAPDSGTENKLTDSTTRVFTDIISGTAEQETDARTGAVINDTVTLELAYIFCDDVRTGAVINAALGLSNTVGEVNDIIKKAVFHGHEIDKTAIKKEIADICWHIALMCDGFGFSMGDVVQMNIERLAARYPDGFSERRSQNRNANDE